MNYVTPLGLHRATSLAKWSRSPSSISDAAIVQSGYYTKYNQFQTDYVVNMPLVSTCWKHAVLLDNSPYANQQSRECRSTSGIAGTRWSHLVQ